MNQSMSKFIEVFTNSNLYGNDIVDRVNQTACSKCTILVYDASNTESSAEMQEKAYKYGVTSMPAIVMDGKLINPEKLVQGKLASIVHHVFKK